MSSINAQRTWQTSWPAAQRASAAKKDKALFVVGIDGRQCDNDRIGRAERSGCLDQEKAAALWKFADLLYGGLAPQEAFDEIDWTTGRYKESWDTGESAS